MNTVLQSRIAGLEQEIAELESQNDKLRVFNYDLRQRLAIVRGVTDPDTRVDEFIQLLIDRNGED